MAIGRQRLPRFECKRLFRSGVLLWRWTRFRDFIAGSASVCSLGECSFGIDFQVIERRCFAGVGKALDEQYVARAQCEAGNMASS